MSINVGSIVHLDRDAYGVPAQFIGVELVVEKLPKGANQKNAIVRPKTGGQGLRIPPSFLREGAPQGLSSSNGVVTTISLELYDPGTVVEFKGTLHVVTANTMSGHRLFPLGGSNRYYRNVPASQFTVVPVTELAARLAR